MNNTAKLCHPTILSLSRSTTHMEAEQHVRNIFFNIFSISNDFVHLSIHPLPCHRGTAAYAN